MYVMCEIMYIIMKFVNMSEGPLKEENANNELCLVDMSSDAEGNSTHQAPLYNWYFRPRTHTLLCYIFLKKF